MSGIYASQPFPGGGRSGFDWSTNQKTGAFYANELGWEPVFGRSQLSGHYKVGVGFDTSNFPDQFLDMNGSSFVLSGLPPPLVTVARRSGPPSTMLFRTGQGPNHGLTVLGAYAHDSPGNSLYQHFVWVGMLYSGFWKARLDDQIGLAFTYYQVSPDLTSTQRLEQAFGLPPTYQYGVQTYAMVLEANYNIPVYRGVQLQPEFEWFVPSRRRVDGARRGGARPEDARAFLIQPTFGRGWIDALKAPTVRRYSPVPGRNQVITSLACRTTSVDTHRPLQPAQSGREARLD